MEVQKTTVTEIKKGATLNPESGEANVPDGNGGVRTETKGDGISYILQDTPRNREVIAKMLTSHGFHEEAGQVLGKKYTPTFFGRVKNVATENTNLLAIGLGFVGAQIIIWGGAKLGKLLAQKMGWNLFGNVVQTQMEEEPKKVSAPRRAPTAPTQIGASA